MSGHDKQNFDFKSATTIGGVEISCGDDGCSEFDVFVGVGADDGSKPISFAERTEGPCQHVHDELINGVLALRELVGGHSLDLLEVCAPWDSPLTKAVRDTGGKSMAIGLHNGYDLTTVSGLKKAIALVRKHRPRYIHVSPPCDPWSAMQNCNQRTEDQIQALELKRQVSKRLLRNCRRLLEIQLLELNGDGGMTSGTVQPHAGGEHPLHAQSWGVQDMKTMVKLCGGRFVVHGCRHGMLDKNREFLLKKPWGWFSTHHGIRNALALTCNHGPKSHPVIEGSNTSLSAVYPPLLCRRFAKALMHDVVEMFPIFTLCDDQVFHGDSAVNSPVSEPDEYEHLLQRRMMLGLNQWMCHRLRMISRTRQETLTSQMLIPKFSGWLGLVIEI